MIVLVQDLTEHFIIILPRTFISIVAWCVFDSHVFPIAFDVSCDFCKHSRYTLPLGVPAKYVYVWRHIHAMGAYSDTVLYTTKKAHFKPWWNIIFVSRYSMLSNHPSVLGLARKFRIGWAGILIRQVG